MFAAAILHLLALKQAEDLVKKVADSGRCVSIAETPDSRVKRGPEIAPGQPPILIFRYYEGKLHHRFGNADLMLDDAGH